MSIVGVQTFVYQDRLGHRYISTQADDSIEYSLGVRSPTYSTPQPVALPSGNMFFVTSELVGHSWKTTYTVLDETGETLSQADYSDHIQVSTPYAVRMEDHTVWALSVGGVSLSGYPSVGAVRIFDTTDGTLSLLDEQTIDHPGLEPAYLWWWKRSRTYESGEWWGWYPPTPIYLRELGLIVLILSSGVLLFRNTELLSFTPFVSDFGISFCQTDRNVVSFLELDGDYWGYSPTRMIDVYVSDDGGEVSVTFASPSSNPAEMVMGFGHMYSTIPLREVTEIIARDYWQGTTYLADPKHGLFPITYGTSVSGEWEDFLALAVSLEGGEVFQAEMPRPSPMGYPDVHQSGPPFLASYCNGRWVVTLNRWDDDETVYTQDGSGTSVRDTFNSVYFYIIDVDYADQFHVSKGVESWTAVGSGATSGSDLLHVCATNSVYRDYRSSDDRQDLNTPRVPLHVMQPDGTWGLVTMMTDTPIDTPA